MKEPSKVTDLLRKLLVNIDIAFHVVAAFLLLVACGFILFNAALNILEPTRASMIALVNDVLLSLIILELLWTVIRFLKKQKFILAPFLANDKPFVIKIDGNLSFPLLKALTAADGQQALDLLETHKYIKAVISDIVMPNVDGFELLARIKSNYPGIPVLLITGHGGRYERKDVISAGADGYITKPFKNIEIVNTLKSFNLQPAYRVNSVR